MDRNLYNSELTAANDHLQDLDILNHDLNIKNSVESLKLRMGGHERHNSSMIEEDRSKIMGTPELEELKKSGLVHLDDSGSSSDDNRLYKKSKNSSLNNEVISTNGTIDTKRQLDVAYSR